MRVKRVRLQKGVEKVGGVSRNGGAPCTTRTGDLLVRKANAGTWARGFFVLVSSDWNALQGVSGGCSGA